MFNLKTALEARVDRNYNLYRQSGDDLDKARWLESVEILSLVYTYFNLLDSSTIAELDDIVNQQEAFKLLLKRGL
jgi:hypothetical protein